MCSMARALVHKKEEGGSDDPLTSPPLPFVFASCETREGRVWRRARAVLPGNGRVFRVTGGQPGSPVRGLGP